MKRNFIMTWKMKLTRKWFGFGLMAQNCAYGGYGQACRHGRALTLSHTHTNERINKQYVMLSSEDANDIACPHILIIYAFPSLDFCQEKVCVLYFMFWKLEDVWFCLYKCVDCSVYDSSVPACVQMKYMNIPDHAFEPGMLFFFFEQKNI